MGPHMHVVLTGLICSFESHTEKIGGALLNWLLNTMKEARGDEFRAFDFVIPEGMPPLTRNLVGPSCGDAPVLDGEVYHAVRPGAADRVWKSRLVDANPPNTRFARAICVPCVYIVEDGVVTTREASKDYEGDTCTMLVLATVYGIAKLGEEQAPPDVDDKDLQPGGRLAHLRLEAVQFWAVHALAVPRT